MPEYIQWENRDVEEEDPTSTSAVNQNEVCKKYFFLLIRRATLGKLKHFR